MNCSFSSDLKRHCTLTIDQSTLDFTRHVSCQFLKGYVTVLCFLLFKRKKMMMMMTTSPRWRRSQTCPLFPTTWPVQLSLLSTPPWQMIRPRCRMGAPPHPLPHPLETAPLHRSLLGNAPCWGPFRGTTPLRLWRRMGTRLPHLLASEHQKAQDLFVSHQWVRADHCSLLSRPSHQCLWSLKMGHMQAQRQRSSRFSSLEHFRLICKVPPCQQPPLQTGRQHPEL